MVVIRLLFFCLCLTFIQSCTTMLAVISYPSSPSVPDDTDHIMSISYLYKNNPVNISYNWTCTYGKNWSASSGWGISQVQSTSNFVRKINDNSYMYVNIPNCWVEGEFSLEAIIFHMENSELHIDSMVSARPDSCGLNFGEIESLKAHITKEKLRPYQKITQPEYAETLNMIRNYSLYVQPIQVHTKDYLKQHPILWHNLMEQNELITAKNYNLRYSTGIPFKNKFPDVPISSRNDKFADYTSTGWTLSKINKKPFLLLKKGEKAPSHYTTYFEGRPYPFRSAFYDPTSESVFFISNPSECILDGYAPPATRYDVNGDSKDSRAETMQSLQVNAGLVPITHSDRYTNTIGMTFNLLPAGTFIMGSPDGNNIAAAVPAEPGRYSNETQHIVNLSESFYMQTTEVTQRQWELVMGLGSNPSHFIDCGLDCPVEKVSWDDTQLFINALNTKEGRIDCGSFPNNCYTLPTESQWEYAARAGTVTALYGGNITYTDCGTVDPIIDAIGWYCGNAKHTTHPVAQKTPNNWGLYDMSGNVFEWCFDAYGAYPSGTVTNPTGADNGSTRVIRGGDWYYNARGTRSAFRYNFTPSYRRHNLGFRLALSPYQ